MTKIEAFSDCLLAFALFLSQLCLKISIMKQSDYEELLGRIGTDCLPLGAQAWFSVSCMCSEAGRRDIENRIYEEFGMSGEELVESIHR